MNRHLIARSVYRNHRNGVGTWRELGAEADGGECGCGTRKSPFQGLIDGPPPPLNDGRNSFDLGGVAFSSSPSLIVRSITALAGRLFGLWTEDCTECSRDDKGGVWVEEPKELGGVAVAVEGLDLCFVDKTRACVFWISTKSSSSPAVDAEP